MAKFRFNPLIIAMYMVPALGWWAYLLWRNYHNLYQKELELLKLTSKVQSHDELVSLPRYLQITDQYQRNCTMVMGEGTVFFLFLLGGLYYMYRTYRKDLELNKRQQNFQLSITHELKTPITSMQLVFDTIKQRSERLSPEQITQLAQTGKRESVRLYSLVNDILLSGQLENKWTPQPKPLVLSKLVEDCRQSVALMYPDHHFVEQLHPEALQLNADEQGMRHVLLNLLENAAKYSPPGSTITLSSEPKGHQTIIKIADQGCGISAEDKTQVFQKFYRSGNENTRETKGTGLGLFVVKQILDAHKGTVTIQDNKPKGSVFILTFG
jgi:two-component system, OmpR family, phosphate regulon sensor histidine kinase PhoR